MLSVQKLDMKQVREIYDTHMQEAFPKSELRPYQSIKTLTKNGNYVCYGLFEEQNLLAYAFFSSTGDGKYSLLDYYAVVKELRGTGIGSRFFPLLREKMRDIDGILIEVESVESTEAEEEKVQRRRRIAFYEKNGCEMTRVKSLLFGVDYRIMVFPVARPVPDDPHVLAELERIYHRMFGGIFYNRVCHPYIQAENMPPAN